MVVRRKAKKSVVRAKKKSKRKGGNFGGLKIKPDAVLAKVIGTGAVSPAEMTKKIWVYIKAKKLMKR